MAAIRFPHVRARRPVSAMTALALVLALPATGCSIRKMAVNKLADALAEGGDVYASDDDPELVRDALPFALKTIESLLVQAPDHPGLLLAACTGFTQYAYAFIETDATIVEPEDYRRAVELRDRALRMYIRARDYGLDALELNYPDIRQRLLTEPEAAAADVGADQIDPLFWTGAAWGAAISLGKTRPDLLADVDAARALLRRTLELDETYEDGAIHQVMISIESLPAAMGGSLERAREHFTRAVELSGGVQASPYVTFAEAVSIQTQDSAEFVELIETALAIDPDAAPSYRLANRIAQRRAEALLERIDEFFLILEDEEEPS